MPRTEITVQEIPAFDGASITWTAGDSTNNHMFQNDGRTIVLVKNGDASAKQATVVSVADEYGRVKDIVKSIAAGAILIVNPLRPNLFNQSGTDAGKVYLDLDADTSVEVAAVRYRN